MFSTLKTKPSKNGFRLRSTLPALASSPPLVVAGLQPGMVHNKKKTAQTAIGKFVGLLGNQAA